MRGRHLAVGLLASVWYAKNEIEEVGGFEEAGDVGGAKEQIRFRGCEIYTLDIWKLP